MIYLLLPAFGCATRYHEPPRADKEAAVLEAVVPVWVVSIDHAKVSRTGITGRKQFRITPGPHTIEVEYSINESTIRAISIKPQPLSFTADAGRTYYIKPGRIDDRWRPFVTDSLQPVFSDPKLN